jgi:hypothetical protein
LLVHVLLPVANEDDALATATGLEPYDPEHVTAPHVVEKGKGVPDKTPVEQSEALAAESYAAVRSVFPDADEHTAYARDVVGAIFEAAAEVGSSANASILASARTNFAMGRGKIITNWLDEIHPNYSTPYRSILVTGALILVFVAFLGRDIAVLAKAASVLHLIVYALMNVGLIVFREARRPRVRSGFHGAVVSVYAHPRGGAVAGPRRVHRRGGDRALWGIRPRRRSVVLPVRSGRNVATGRALELYPAP